MTSPCRRPTADQATTPEVVLRRAAPEAFELERWGRAVPDVCRILHSMYYMHIDVYIDVYVDVYVDVYIYI